MNLSWSDDWEDCEEPPIHHPIPGELVVTENPVVAELLGPEGEPIRQWRERAQVRFGFQRSRGMRAR